MWFWWMMLAFNLLVPIIMILSGRMMRMHCPEDINGAFGYRTKRSMKNKETWKFAHTYCGKLWWKIGFILLILTIFVHMLFLRGSMETVSVSSLLLMFLQTAVMLLTIIPTENALKKNFDDQGNAL